MIRITLLSLFIVFLSIYAWKDWYKSLCGIIVLMAFMQHPDMPTNIMQIQGLNPWNFVMINVLLAWFINRRKEGLRWGLPIHVNLLLIAYFVIVIISFARMISDPALVFETNAAMGMRPPTMSNLWADFFINSIKWVIPGLLLCHGCNSKQRLYWALSAVILFYLLLALQVIKWMPLTGLGGVELKDRGGKILAREIGYHRVDIAMMLAGAFWACFVLSTVAVTRKIKYLLYLACIAMFLGLALTGGRTGYGTWLGTGFVLAAFRWRRFLLLLPLVVIMVVLTMPFVVDRLTQGFGNHEIQKNVLLEKDGLYDREDGKIDLYTVTAGRVIAWPFVIKKITDAPWTGYGRLAMMRTGIALLLVTRYGETFPHPHNAYLEIVLDNGIPQALVVLLLFLTLWKNAIFMIRHSSNKAMTMTGGLLGSVLTAQLIASFGSQSFYPSDGSVALWCAIGLMLRVRYSMFAKAPAKQRSRPTPAHHPTPQGAMANLATQHRSITPSALGGARS